MEIFEELPVDQWPVLQEKLVANWPRNIAGYYALKKNMQYPNLRKKIQLKVFVPYGDMDNGFIAKSLRGNDATFMMFAVTEDTSKLEEAVAKTEIIDWSIDPSFIMLSSETLQIFNNAKLRMGQTISVVDSVTMYYLDHTAQPFTDLSLPVGTYLAQVKENDIATVNGTWAYASPTSHIYFADLASNGFSYGLYSRSSDDLRAWMFCNEYNYLRHLYCEESHRKKGYAEYVCKFVVNEQLRQGNDVYCFVDKSNKAPMKLFEKLGFKAIEEIYYTRSKHVLD